MSDIDLIPNGPPRKAHPNSIKYMRRLSEERDDTQMTQNMPEQWKALYYAVLNGSDDIAHKDVDVFITQLKKQPIQQKRQLGTAINQSLLKAADQAGVEYGSFAHGVQEVMGAVEQWQEASKVTTPNPFIQGTIELQDGMYRIPDTGTIYKVYHTVQGANIQVAKRLMINNSDASYYEGQGPVKAKFKYEGRAPLKKLTPAMRMTLEQAREFGAVYGTCCICARTLTNELSIHLGIGPVCGRRQFGGEFEFLINKAKIDLGMPAKQNYPNGMSASGTPFTKAELEARLAEINQELGN